MKWNCRIALQLVVVFAIFAMPSATSAAEDDAKAREQFERVLQGVNDKNFLPIKNAIVKDEMAGRVLDINMLDLQVKNAFDDNYWEIVERIAMSNMPNVNEKVDGEIVAFDFKDGKGQAVVRYNLANYTFAYQIWELRHSRGARLRVDDWFNSNQGQSLVEAIADELLVLMPNKDATRRLIGDQSPTDQQLFQTTELLKAGRDRQAQRFLEIYDDLDPHLRTNKLIAGFALRSAYSAQDPDRFLATLQVYADTFADDPYQSMLVSDAYLLIQRLPESYAALENFHGGMTFSDGAMPAKLSAMALALGKASDAQRYAAMAISNEPTLELGWWSLLRAHASESNFADATVAVARLEDDFGHRLDEASLKRDRFQGLGALAESEEFRDWRASNP